MKKNMPRKSKNKTTVRQTGKQNGKEYVNPSVAKGIKMSNRTPRVGNVGKRTDGSIKVMNREWLGSLLASNDPGTFSVVFSRNVNPGLKVSFPWLSAIANNYETYKFQKLEFSFTSCVGTSNSGSVYMYVDYDSADAGAPVSKADFMSNFRAVRCPVWDSTTVRCDRDDLNKAITQYTRRGVHTVSDIKSYDVGLFHCAIEGFPIALAGTTLGDLYVEYEVILSTPQCNLSEAIDAGCAKAFSDTGTTPAAPFGTARTVTGGLGIDVGNGYVLFPEIGQYLVDLEAFGTTFSNRPDITPHGVNYTPLNYAKNATSTYMWTQFLVDVLHPDAYIDVNYTAKADTITSATLRLAPYLAALA